MREHPARAWVEVDLGALCRNGAALQARGAALLPMVKADGYGLGAAAVACALERLAPWGYGVATVDEGIVLREAGITRPILVFTPPFGPDLGEARRAGLTPALGSARAIADWQAVGGGAWHLEIDTGMSRSGVRWDAIDTLRPAVAAAPPEGAFTHFHSAELSDGSVPLQERRFSEAVAALPARPRLLHAEASAALARVTRSRWDLARPGVFLYGVGSGPGALVEPEPVVRVCARVVDLRTLQPGDTVSYYATWRAPAPRRIATLAIGYADGYPRALGNRGTALVRGRRAPVVGIITMDMLMLDVTEIACEVGDVAILIGSDGAERLDVETVARTADVSPYELLVRLGGRLPRVYVGDA